MILTQQEVREKLGIDIDTDYVTSREFIMEHVVYRVINDKRRNQKIKMIYRKYLDLAVTYCVVINKNVRYQMTDEIMENKNITMRELEEAAKRNTRKQGYYYKTMNEMLGMEDTFCMMPKGYVVTNKTGLFGAAAMQMAELMDEIADKFGGRCIVIPSSIHELILTSYRPDKLDLLNDHIKKLNEYLFTEEVLSDHAYIYESGKGMQIVV